MMDDLTKITGIWLASTFIWLASVQIYYDNLIMLRLSFVGLMFFAAWHTAQLCDLAIENDRGIHNNDGHNSGNLPEEP